MAQASQAFRNHNAEAQGALPARSVSQQSNKKPARYGRVSDPALRSVEQPRAIASSKAFPKIDTKLFLLAASVATVAASSETAANAAVMKRVLTRNGDGRCCGVISFEDGDVNYLERSVARYFGRNESGFRAFTFRWFALMKLLSSSSRTPEWTTDRDGQVFIDDAVFRVAARFPFDERYDFDEGTFFAEVAREHDRIASAK